MPSRALIVFGTRPEAIKMAPLIRELRARPEQFRTTVCSTGQHREMLDQVVALFGIHPDLDLDIMRPGQTLAALTASAIRAFDDVLAACTPEIVLVQGDTTTAMACALAGFYRQIPVGHVEAGLRTGDPSRPFPEEINRRAITCLARWNFAPTARAAEALRAEGVPEDRISITGNTVIDALEYVLSLPVPAGEVPPYPSPEHRLVLVTAHRRESFGEPFERLCLALRSVALAHPDVEIVYPVHLNPRVQEPVRRILAGVPRVHLVAPLSYRPFSQLMRRATLILTDSGGIQEEAPSLGVPVLVMREETERPEAIEAGVARLVGTSMEGITTGAGRLLQDESARREMIRSVSPFGDGRAAKRIADVLAAACPRGA